MSNPALKPGAVGQPHVRLLPDGRYEARLLCRNNLGAYRKPRRTGRTEHEAVRKARRAAAEWIGRNPGSHTVKPTTRLSDLADIWLAETKLRGHLAAGTLAIYEYQLDRSHGRGTRRDAIKIKPSIGSLTVREATTARMNEYMITLMERGHTAKATQHWIILSSMFDTARRHGTIDHNPMDATLRPARRLDEPHTLPHTVFDDFLRQVDTWCHDEAIPGRPERCGGTTRDARIYWVIQLLLDTGVRPGELLGLRIHDVELDAPIPGIWVRGKLENQGTGHGWRWHPGLKTGTKGIRRLALEGPESFRTARFWLSQAAWFAWNQADSTSFGVW